MPDRGGSAQEVRYALSISTRSCPGCTAAFGEIQRDDLPCVRWSRSRARWTIAGRPTHGQGSWLRPTIGSFSRVVGGISRRLAPSFGSGELRQPGGAGTAGRRLVSTQEPQSPPS